MTASGFSGSLAAMQSFLRRVLVITLFSFI
jgi:hypothetical protein